MVTMITQTDPAGSRLNARSTPTMYWQDLLAGAIKCRSNKAEDVLLLRIHHIQKVQLLVRRCIRRENVGI